MNLETIKFCSLCVISNQRPSSSVEFTNQGGPKRFIDFDAENICEACRYNQIKKEINWKEREKQLYKILNKYRLDNGQYDCIVPSSGGKDSSFTAHKLKYKYGMNPLTVTWAPNMFTEVGWNNFNNLARVGGIDNLLYTPSGPVHQLFTKLSFLNLCHPFQPFIIGQKIIGPKIAQKFNIPLIVYGENQAEYGNDIAQNNIFEMDKRFYSTTEPLKMRIGGQTVDSLMKEHHLKYNDLTAYLPLTPVEVSKSNLNFIYLGYFERWDPQECFYYSVENTGFQPAAERSEGTYSKYTEIDDIIVPFHFYTTLIKFGIGRATYDASQEIRNNKISREEGVQLVRKYDEEFPSRSFKTFIEYLNISENDFVQTTNRFRPDHIWQSSGENEWKLRKAVWH
jgi:N-acetyl sugar amidotransferase